MHGTYILLLLCVACTNNLEAISCHFVPLSDCFSSSIVCNVLCRIVHDGDDDDDFVDYVVQRVEKGQSAGRYGQSVRWAGEMKSNKNGVGAAVNNIQSAQNKGISDPLTPINNTETTAAIHKCLTSLRKSQVVQKQMRRVFKVKNITITPTNKEHEATYTCAKSSAG